MVNRIEKLKEFLRDSPSDNFLRHALALEFIKAGDDAAARKLFEEILIDDAGYIGSYYHLGKLLERGGLPSEAEDIYKRGMAEAKKAGDQHAFNELRSALDEISD